MSCQWVQTCQLGMARLLEAMPVLSLGVKCFVVTVGVSRVMCDLLDLLQK